MRKQDKNKPIDTNFQQDRTGLKNLDLFQKTKRKRRKK